MRVLIVVALLALAALAQGSMFQVANQENSLASNADKHIALLEEAASTLEAAMADKPLTVDHEFDNDVAVLRSILLEAQSAIRTARNANPANQDVLPEPDNIPVFFEQTPAPAPTDAAAPAAPAPAAPAAAPAAPAPAAPAAAPAPIPVDQVTIKVTDDPYARYAAENGITHVRNVNGDNPKSIDGNKGETFLTKDGQPAADCPCANLAASTPCACAKPTGLKPNPVAVVNPALAPGEKPGRVVRTEKYSLTPNACNNPQGCKQDATHVEDPFFKPGPNDKITPRVKRANPLPANAQGLITPHPLITPKYISKRSESSSESSSSSRSESSFESSSSLSSSTAQVIRSESGIPEKVLESSESSGKKVVVANTVSPVVSSKF